MNKYKSKFKRNNKSLANLFNDIFHNLHGLYADSHDLTDFILFMFFYKSLSDEFDKQRNRVVKKLLSEGKSEKVAQNLSLNSSLYPSRVFIPESSSWKNLKNQEKDFSSFIIDSSITIEDINPQINGILKFFRSSIKLINDKQYKTIITQLSKQNLSVFNLKKHNMLNSLFEKVKGHYLYYYFPEFITQLITTILRPTRSTSMFDPCAYAGSNLINLMKSIDVTNTKNLFVNTYDSREYIFCKINFLLNGFNTNNINYTKSYNFNYIRTKKVQEVEKAIECKNVNFEGFDIITSQLLFFRSHYFLKHNISEKNFISKFGRPATNNTNLTMIIKMIEYIKPKGQGAFITSIKRLFFSKSKKDYYIKKLLVEDDIIESIIKLPLEFYNLEAQLIIINKNKTQFRKKNILYIDGSKFGNNSILQEVRHNYLKPNYQSSIIQTISLNKIIKNNYDLSMYL